MRACSAPSRPPCSGLQLPRRRLRPKARPRLQLRFLAVVALVVLFLLQAPPKILRSSIGKTPTFPHASKQLAGFENIDPSKPEDRDKLKRFQEALLPPKKPRLG